MTEPGNLGDIRVFIVDDDLNLLTALRQRLSMEGWAVVCFASVAQFEAQVERSEIGVLLLDVDFPGEFGLALQARMTARGDDRPIIFMTGRDEVPLAVQAIKGGALDYLIKPFEESTLLEAVTRAARRQADQHHERHEFGQLEQSFNSLSLREREVMSQVVAGKMNKQIASELSLAEVTVKVYRSRMMHKMKASSVAALVKLHERLRRR